MKLAKISYTEIHRQNIKQMCLTYLNNLNICKEQEIIKLAQKAPEKKLNRTS